MTPGVAIWAARLDETPLDEKMAFRGKCEPGHLYRYTDEKTGQHFGTYINGDATTGGGHGHRECNHGWRLEDFYSYADWAETIPPRQDSSRTWMHFPSITEFVQSFAQMCQHPGAAFGWPCAKLSFLRSVEQAFERLTPGTEFCLKSSKPMPQHLLRPRTESDSADRPVYHRAGQAFVLDDGVEKYFHGTDLASLMHILRDGIAPSVSGAGMDSVAQSFGVSVPMVYTAPYWGCALTYPMHETSNTDLPRTPEFPIPRLGVNAGSLAILHLSYPFRCVLQVYYRVSTRIRCKRCGDTSQSAFPAGLGHISHVWFVGMHASLIPKSLTYTGVVPLQRDLFQESKHAYDHRTPCASRARIEIDSAKIALVLKHKDFEPWFPRPLSSEGNFADGSPAVWTPEYIDQLLACENPKFAGFMKTQFENPFDGLGSWVPVSLEDTELVWRGQQQVRVLKPSAFNRNGAAEDWMRGAKGVNPHMAGLSRTECG